jgi:Ni/Co efflux regulator RcnB
MNTRLLLSTAAVICLVLPGAVIAAPPGDRGGGDQKGEQRQGQDQRAQKAERAQKGQQPQRAPEAQRGQASQQAPQGGGPQGGGPKGRGPAQAAQPAPQPQPQPAQPRQARPDRQPTRQPPVQQRAPQPQAQPRPPFQASGPRGPVQQSAPQHPAAQPSPPRGPVASLGAWHAPARGPERTRANQQWRQQNSGWDRSAPWRRSPTWWRGDPGFSLFVGPRIGFFFVPGLGYRDMPALYRDRHWRAGDYLPGMFRAYVVADYRRYGLPRPPFGCVWIWLNGDVALIDRSDGYILDVVTNVW